MWIALLLSLPASAQGQEPPRTDPARATLVYDDVPRFWEAFDAAIDGGQAELEQALRDLYLDPGSPGVRGFTQGRIESARHLAQVVLAQRAQYEAARTRSLALRELEPQLRALFQKAHELYPEFVFPTVYFVIGALNSGGTSTDAGLILGVEMDANRPETLPALVMHELVHFQQGGSARPVNLLGQCFHEGSADFLGELVSGGNINAKSYAYAAQHERELWAEFEKVRSGTERGRWLYVYDERALAGWPPDLGYWAGYQIAAAYYRKAADKHQAIHDILHVQDYEAFLAASGYPEAR